MRRCLPGVSTTRGEGWPAKRQAPRLPAFQLLHKVRQGGQGPGRARTCPNKSVPSPAGSDLASYTPAAVRTPPRRTTSRSPTRWARTSFGPPDVPLPEARPLAGGALNLPRALMAASHAPRSSVGVLDGVYLPHGPRAGPHRSRAGRHTRKISKVER
jgi:hypothetical protein